MLVGLRQSWHAMVWVEHRSPVQQDAGDPEQPIGDAAQRATVRVSTRPERLVADAAFGVMLHGDPRPVEHGLAQPGLGGVAHDTDRDGVLRLKA